MRIQKNLEDCFCFVMAHRGGLEEAVQTVRSISATEFNHYLHSFHFYAYDSRINAYRFLFNDLEHNQYSFDWLLLSTDENIFIRGNK